MGRALLTRSANTTSVAWFVVTALSLLLFAAPVSAQPTAGDRATATALFDNARKLMKAGDHAAACPKLEEAKRLAPGVGIVFNLAVCFEEIGRSASAWGLYREAASLAAAAGQAERASAAKQKANALEPSLTRLEIVVVDPPMGMTIEVNGNPVGEPLWNTATPVDPGSFRVDAAAPGHQPWRTDVNAKLPGETVRVSVPPLIAATSGDALPPVDDVEVVDDDVETNDWQVPLGVSMLALGVVGVGVGGVLGLVAKSNADDADCNDDDVCRTQEAVDTRSDAVALGNIATGVMIAGAVVAGAGLALWLTAPSDDDVAIRLSPTNLALRVRF